MQTMADYILYLDDERDPPNDEYVLVRTNDEAKAVIRQCGLPTFMSLDHDLGVDCDGNTVDVMQFVSWLAENYYDQGPPDWHIHSANPEGRKNLDSKLNSWKKSLSL
jgi:hypothetical protein